MKQTPRSLKNPRARLTGVLYLLYFLTATGAAVMSSHELVVLSDIVNVISLICYIAVTLMFYYMFSPVSKVVSLIAALFSLSGCAFTAGGIFHFSRLELISPLVFFGPFCILIGWLILKSTFLPKFLGGLMVLAGLGWLAFLSPLVVYLSVYIKAIGVLAEAALMLWLIIMAVNIERWKEQASATK
jgi:hypothetical protein